MASAPPTQRPRTPSDSQLSDGLPLSPDSGSKDRHGSLRRRPSFSFLRRSKSREGASRTVSQEGARRSSSGGSLSGRKLSKKKLVLEREREMRQENIPPFPHASLIFHARKRSRHSEVKIIDQVAWLLYQARLIGTALRDHIHRHQEEVLGRLSPIMFLSLRFLWISLEEDLPLIPWAELRV